MRTAMTNLPNLTKPIVIGIVGGVASGKSTLTDLLRSEGAEVIDADKIAHEVLLLPSVVEQIVETFGEEVLGESPESRVIDRKRLGAIVFGDEPTHHEARKKLEAIVHKIIRSLGRDRLAALKQQPGLRWIVLDAPLLIEGGWVPFCDRIWFLETPAELRCKWAIARGWTKAQWESREKSQLSLEEKRRLASDVLPNAGDRSELVKLVRSKLANLAAAST
jgi:dephospho-CoA kinase